MSMENFRMTPSWDIYGNIRIFERFWAAENYYYYVTNASILRISSTKGRFAIWEVLHLNFSARSPNCVGVDSRKVNGVNFGFILLAKNFISFIFWLCLRNTMTQLKACTIWWKLLTTLVMIMTLLLNIYLTMKLKVEIMRWRGWSRWIGQSIYCRRSSKFFTFHCNSRYLSALNKFWAWIVPVRETPVFKCSISFCCSVMLRIRRY